MKSMLIILSSWLFLSFGFSSSLPSIHPNPNPADTIKHISDLRDRAVFKTRDGRFFSVHFVPDSGEAEMAPVKLMKRKVHGIVRTTSVANQACDNGNKFDGSYRAAAKESYVTPLTAVQSPSGLNALIATLLAVSPSLLNSISSGSARVSPEKKNISISAFLYAIKRESDEDYHIIIGSSQSPAAAKFFNVECSGLPATSSSFYARLHTVRNQLDAFMGGEVCKNGYTFFDNHPAVRVKGSLFYDKEHASSIVGPAQCKPQTAWELHPLTDFRMN